jgi:hypothetical protein
VDREKRLHDLRAFAERLAQGTSLLISGAEDVAKRHDSPSALLTDGPTEEAIVVKHTHVRHSAGVVPEHDRRAHVRR